MKEKDDHCDVAAAQRERRTVRRKTQRSCRAADSQICCEGEEGEEGEVSPQDAAAAAASFVSQQRCCKQMQDDLKERHFQGFSCKQSFYFLKGFSTFTSSCMQRDETRCKNKTTTFQRKNSEKENSSLSQVLVSYLMSSKKQLLADKWSHFCFYLTFVCVCLFCVRFDDPERKCVQRRETMT